VPGKIFRELEQLISAQLSVAIGVEPHRMLDQTLGRRTACRSASRTIRSVAATAAEPALAASVVIRRTAAIFSRPTGAPLVRPIGARMILRASTSSAFCRPTSLSFGGPGRP